MDRRLIRSRTSSALCAATKVPASITDNLPVKVSQITKGGGAIAKGKGWVGLGWVIVIAGKINNKSPVQISIVLMMSQRERVGEEEEGKEQQEQWEEEEQGV